MDYNPLTETCAQIQRQIDELERSASQATADLQWYYSVDPRRLAEDLRSSEFRAEQLQREIRVIDKDIHENNARLAEIEPAIGTLLNPFNWFAKGQLELRRRRSELRAIGDRKLAQRHAKVMELEATRARIAEVAKELERHRTFDSARRQSELAQIKQNIVAKKEELAIVAARKRRVDELLEPLIQQMQNLESRKRRAQSDLEVAQDFDQQLSSADNSYERAMIHEECERRFGEGSPRKIISERQREIRQLERDYEKAKRRVEDIARKAARRIDTIVIDGNNLCYEGDKFIGLAAIEALLPSLSRTCAVVIVFDSSIRRLLNTNDSGLQKRLGNYPKVQVHIVASRQMADETVLDLACANDFTYVLSNDRFGDFNEKSAIKEGRVIRHEIVHGQIFVHDLQLRAAYSTKRGETRQ
jgi:hypothetical protein